MGLTEILRHLPRLWRLRSALQRRILEWRPDVFIGIDFKEFNLGLARRLKKQGLRTVQYVSPQVWAWRQGRARTIGEAVDLILCLFPFEPDFYREYGVRATFVGHPLADQIPMEVDRAAARAELGVHAERARARGVAWQPPRRGRASRRTLRRRRRVAGRALSRAGVHCAHGDAGSCASCSPTRCAALAPRAAVRMLDGHARLALAAADVVLVASGTATLEAALCKRPMVVAYRLGAITAFLLRHARAGEGAAFLAAQSARRHGAGAGVLPGAGQRRQPGRRAGRLARAARARWRACRASSRRSTRRCGAAARNSRPRRSPSCSRRGRRTPIRGGAMKMRVRLRVAGVDEAGRGPLAGPVVAAAVILNPARPIRGLADSKVLEPEERERLALLIRERALCHSVAWADAEEIDSINILQATMLAMRRALLGLRDLAAAGVHRRQSLSLRAKGSASSACSRRW